MNYATCESSHVLSFELVINGAFFIYTFKTLTNLFDARKLVRVVIDIGYYVTLGYSCDEKFFHQLRNF